MEALGAVVSEVELQKVALVEAVGEAPREACVAGRKAELQGTCVGIQRLSGREYQQAGDVVSAEFPGVVQAALGIHCVGDGLGAFAVAEPVGTGLVDALHVVLSRIGIVGVHSVPVGREGTIDLVVGEPGEVEERHEMQALGDEVEVLVELHGRDHLRTLGVLVSAHQVGVRVGVGSVLVVTEHYVLDAHVVGVIGIVGREEHGVGVHHLLVNRVTAVQGAGVVGEVTGQAHGQFGGGGDVDVHVRTQGVGLLVDVVVEGVALIDLEDTSILRKSARDIVCSHLAAASGRDVGTVGGRVVLEEHIVPVVGRIDEAVGVGLAGLLYLVVGVHKLAEGVAGGDGLVERFHICDGVGQLHGGSRLGDGGLDAGENLRRAFLAALGGDVDHTVCTSRTIKGGSGGILHDRETLDIVRLKAREVGGGQFYVVD